MERFTKVPIKNKLWRFKKFQFSPLQEEEEIKNFLHEIVLLYNLNHPHIIKFVGACLGRTICIVNEYCIKGNLLHYLQNTQLELSHKFRFAYEIVSALNYLHTLSPPIVHRDLKCSNILVSDKDMIKIADFGLSHYITDVSQNHRIGTIGWAAPEILLKGEIYSTKADVYSFGTVLWEILNNGATPYPYRNEIQLIRAIADGEKPVLKNLSPDVENVIKRCWSASPSERPSFLILLGIVQNFINQ